MKRKSLLKRIAHILSAALLIFGQVILPTNAAFAAPNDNNPARPGNDQPVWCMIVGYGWTAQLGGNNNNRFPLTQLPANADNSLSIGASGKCTPPTAAARR
jgi:hypothetical protein